MNKYFQTTFLFLAASLHAQAGTFAITVKDSGGKPLADTAVYLQATNPLSIAQTGEIQVEQKNKEFHPFVSVTPTGSRALFPNHDGIGHHVYSFSPAKTFELPLSEAESSMSVQFDTAGIITVGCNIHDWMVGYIYVVNTPYHAVTGNNGQTTLNNVPAGNYTVYVWHPGIKSGVAIEQQIVINDTESIQQDFSLDIKPEYFWKPPRPLETEEEQY